MGLACRVARDARKAGRRVYVAAFRCTAAMMDRRTWADAAGGFPGFLMIKESTDQPSAPSQIIVVQHFDDELKRLVPTK
jgi:hypothetical protein